jgi:hypothetical protein
MMMEWMSHVDRPAMLAPFEGQIGCICKQRPTRHTLFSFACVLPGHLWMCRTLSDPVATLQYATPVPIARVSKLEFASLAKDMAHMSCQNRWMQQGLVDFEPLP